VGPRSRKALRILIGTVLMGGFVVLVFVVLSRYAGSWGVPYFSFTTERGSTCTNDFAGYTCTELTLAEVEYFGQFDLPDDATVLQGRYRSTHDYQLDALLSVPPASSAAALKSLNSNFGRCVKGRLSPLDARGLTKICVLATDDTVRESGEPASRLYSIGTGVHKDGTRTIALSIESR
jgi:hypothetical protein